MMNINIMKAMIKFSLAILMTLVISGCSTIPEKLRVSDNAPLVAFADVRAEPNVNTGLTARWGGVIAKVEVQKQRTLVEVVNFKLSSRAKPIQANETQGRFRFYKQGLLDPVIYKVGKSITVLGTVANSEQGKIGEQTYLYPVLNAEQVQLWKKTQRVNVNLTQQPFWYTPSYWNYYPTYPYSSVIIHRNGSNKMKKPANIKH